MLNHILTAAASGAVAALTQSLLDPANINFKVTGSVAVVGALIGVLNLMRETPRP